MNRLNGPISTKIMDCLNGPISTKMQIKITVANFWQVYDFSV